MTFLLLQEIESFLKQVFAEPLYREPDGWYAKMRFFIGALPPKRKLKGEEQKEDFPFIVIRVREGKDDQEDGSVVVELCAGIYTEEEDAGAGDNDILNVVDRVRRFLEAKQILGARYKLEWPVTWKLGSGGDDVRQPHPYYMAMVTTRWTTPAIERQLTLEEEATIYGN